MKIIIIKTSIGIFAGKLDPAISNAMDKISYVLTDPIMLELISINVQHPITKQPGIAWNWTGIKLLTKTIILYLERPLAIFAVDTDTDNALAKVYLNTIAQEQKETAH